MQILKLAPAMDPICTIVPFAFISKGRKVWHIVMTAKKLVSNVWRTSVSSTSIAGTV
jgi:hypothetical protein